MNKSNQAVRDDLARCNIRQWELAAALGIGETTLVRWLRAPLSTSKLEQIYVAMNRINNERSANRGVHAG